MGTEQLSVSFFRLSVNYIIKREIFIPSPLTFLFFFFFFLFLFIKSTRKSVFTSPRFITATSNDALIKSLSRANIFFQELERRKKRKSNDKEKRREGEGGRILNPRNVTRGIVISVRMAKSSSSLTQFLTSFFSILVHGALDFTHQLPLSPRK